MNKTRFEFRNVVRHLLFGFPKLLFTHELIKVSDYIHYLVCQKVSLCMC